MSLKRVVVCVLCVDITLSCCGSDIVISGILAVPVVIDGFPSTDSHSRTHRINPNRKVFHASTSVPYGTLGEAISVIHLPDIEIDSLVTYPVSPVFILA